MQGSLLEKHSQKPKDITFGGDTIPIILPRHLVQDIDTPEDWKRAEYMYEALKRSENEDR